MPSKFDPKQAAISFLELVVAGKIDEAYDTHVDMNGKHHNLYVSAGFPALRAAMKENHQKFPHKKFSIRHIALDGEMVITHSHITLEPGTPGMIVMHVFRFEHDKITEMWDAGQPIPLDQPNTDGAF